MIVLASVKVNNEELNIFVNEFYPRKVAFKSINDNFVVERKEVAEMMINSILNKLVKKSTFGSKMPVIYRKYPSAIVTADYLIIFDYSEI